MTKPPRPGAGAADPAPRDRAEAATEGDAARAMTPFSRALRAYLDGDEDAEVRVRRDDGLVMPLPARHFFRPEAELSLLERQALDACRGRVLDVGAGAGVHSLVLQGRGVPVRALDVSPGAVEVLRDRGVRDVVRADIRGYTGPSFDTVLLLGHGIGMVADIAGLDRFLAHARRLVGEGGQILLDSVDVTLTDEPDHLAYHEANRRRGRYVGEIRVRFEYDDLAGPICGWLHVDSETLRERAAAAGWSCDVLRREESGDYLARLTVERDGRADGRVASV